VTRDGQTITISAGCMNRPEPLSQSLASWVSLSEVDHVVVVDWSSGKPLRSLALADPRIIVVRVDGQKFWRNSLCHNLEITAASELRSDLLLRLDADVVVRPDFFRKHPVDVSSFYALDCHRVPPQLDHKRSLCGTIYAHVSHLLAANGYNERLRQYGYEDEDLFNRLRDGGLNWKQYDLDSLHHIPHTDEMRLQHLDVGDAPPEIARVGAKSVVEHYIYKSLALAKVQPWGPSDIRTRWKLSRPAENYWEAQPCS